MNSKCYRKFDNSIPFVHSWYEASNECVSRNGSLAVFTDIGRPSDNSQLTDWLNSSGVNNYNIGLIQSWWTTTDEGKLEIRFANKALTILKYFVRSTGLNNDGLKDYQHNNLFSSSSLSSLKPLSAERLMRLVRRSIVIVSFLTILANG